MDKNRIGDLTLKEKVALLSGGGFWHTTQNDRLKIPRIVLTDGPHGVRYKPDDEKKGTEVLPSTCYPAACLSACSFDRDLLREEGKAIASEAKRLGVNVVLGPGINIKRNPLCGRNFEYFSEDPYLTGQLAASWVEGLQSMGVGACVKHFALNNQEYKRFSSNSMADERAMREIYLAAFEDVVKNARPKSLMCSYNKIDGVHACEHTYLLRDVLRDEWNFQGLVMTDWGAMDDRVRAVRAGLALEMPSYAEFASPEIIQAVENGTLDEESIDCLLMQLFDLIDAVSYERETQPVDFNVGGDIAQKIAEDSCVLMKNDGLLPLKSGNKIAVVGGLAKRLRYQGAGSSKIQSPQALSLIDAFDLKKIPYRYFEGYTEGEDVCLTQEMRDAVTAADAVILCLGLPPEYESEGYDREHMRLPKCQLKLAEEVMSLSSRVAVVLFGGSVVELPFVRSAAAVLNMYLGGMRAGVAAQRVLLGEVNPSGKLAETYPVAYEDCACSEIFAKQRDAEYRESVYVGYRYYDKARKRVAFPFGHGLSYTKFTYSDLTVTENEAYRYDVCVQVTNTGNRFGKEVVQLYVGKCGEGFFPEKELRGFEKIALQPGETKEVRFALGPRDFSHYASEARDWTVYAGDYEIMIAASSRDIRERKVVRLAGEELPRTKISNWYIHPQGKPTEADFLSLYQKPVEQYGRKKGEYDLSCCIDDMKDSFMIRRVIRRIQKTAAKMLHMKKPDFSDPAYRMMLSAALELPLRNFCVMMPEIKKSVVDAIVCFGNGKFFQGVGKLLRKS